MNKIKVLFVAANPMDTARLKLDEEIRSITEKIRASEYRDMLELVSIWAVRADDLLQALNTHKPHIVHFSGHGNSTGQIMLVDDTGVSKPLNTKAIKALFSTLKDNILVVILNACYSRVQAKAITQVIDCAIGMNNAIGDQAAITFAASFYRAIGFGRSVQDAFEQGKTALLMNGILEENTPRLLAKRGVNPSSIFPLKASLQMTDDYAALPQRLKDLIDSGVQYIDIPLPPQVKAITSDKSYDYIYCELKMRQTTGIFVFRAPRILEVGYASEYLISQIAPHLSLEDYEWVFEYNGGFIPIYHTFATANIQSGDVLHLTGNHKRPYLPLKPVDTHNGIKLAWQSTPRDLDLYLKIDSDEGVFMVFCGRMGNLKEYPWAQLDTDIRNGFGPETIEVKQWSRGKYQCAVYNYSNESRLADSGAVVELEFQNIKRTFECPTVGNGQWWSVFILDTTTGNIQVINQIVETLWQNQIEELRGQIHFRRIEP